ncbi:hypothetical protein cypCar_00028891, partial [Cyprinus carpio]
NKRGWQQHTRAQHGKKRGERCRGKGRGRRKRREGTKQGKELLCEWEKEESCGPLEFDARHAASSAQHGTKIEPGTWGAFQEKGTARRREALIPNHESQQLSTEGFVLPSRCLEVEYRLPVQGLNQILQEHGVSTQTIQYALLK